MSAECGSCGSDLVYAEGEWPIGHCPKCKAETLEERRLHAIYDAWKWLDIEADALEDESFAGVARAILAGQLKDYAPYAETVADA